MVQSATGSRTVAPPVGRPLAVDVQGGRRTSDGGWPWVAEADADLRRSQTLAAALPDRRHRRGR